MGQESMDIGVRSMKLPFPSKCCKLKGATQEKSSKLQNGLLSVVTTELLGYLDEILTWCKAKIISNYFTLFGYTLQIM